MIFRGLKLEEMLQKEITCFECSENNPLERRLVYEAMQQEPDPTTVTDLMKRLSQTLYGPGRCGYTTAANIDKTMAAAEKLVGGLDHFIEELGSVYVRIHLDRIVPRLATHGVSCEDFKELLNQSAKPAASPPYQGIGIDDLVPYVAEMLDSEDADAFLEADLPQSFNHTGTYPDRLYIVCRKNLFMDRLRQLLIESK